MCELFEFVFGSCLMTLEFLVFEMVPDFFIRIPVGRILRKVEHV